MVDRFVKQLYITAKAVRLYPAASNMPKERAAALLAVLKTAHQSQPAMQLHFARDGIWFGPDPVFPGSDAYVEFAREFYSRNVDSVVFHVGVTAHELVEFLSLLVPNPDELRAAGGFASRLWDLGVTGITVKEISARIVDAAEVVTEETQEAWPPTPEDIDDALMGPAASRPGTRRLLMRVVLDRDVIFEYLRASDAARGVTPPDALLAGRVSALARAVATEPDEDREQLQQSLAETVLSLAGEERRSVLVERLLPAARREPATAAVIAHMDTAQLAEAVIADFDPTQQDAAAARTRSGLARALHNLEMLGVHPRDEVETAFSARLAHKGASSETIASIISEAMPSSVTVATPARPEDPSVASAIEVVQFAAAVPLLPDGTDADLAQLRDEARLGIDDGTVLATLVAVATHERRPEEFAHAVNVLEDSVVLLLEGQHFADAADAAEALIAAAHDEGRPPDQAQGARERLEVDLGRALHRGCGGGGAALSARVSRAGVLSSAATPPGRRVARDHPQGHRRPGGHGDAQGSRGRAGRCRFRVHPGAFALGRRPPLVPCAQRGLRPRPYERPGRVPGCRPRRALPGAQGQARGDPRAGGAARPALRGLPRRSSGRSRRRQRAAGGPRPRQPPGHLGGGRAAAHRRGRREGQPRARPPCRGDRRAGPDRRSSSIPLLESLARVRGLRAMGRGKELAPAAERALAAIEARQRRDAPGGAAR